MATKLTRALGAAVMVLGLAACDETVTQNTGTTVVMRPVSATPAARGGLIVNNSTPYILTGVSVRSCSGNVRMSLANRMSPRSNRSFVVPTGCWVAYANAPGIGDTSRRFTVSPGSVTTWTITN